VQAHLLIPATFRDDVLAVLSLQWKQPRPMSEEELAMIHQSAQQVGMALTCARYRQAVAV
jgi:GAF domain-containing protein